MGALKESRPKRLATPPLVPGDPLTDSRNPLHCDTIWVGNLLGDDLSEADFRRKFAV